MITTDLDAIRGRIQRAFAAAKDASGNVYHASYLAEDSNFITNFKVTGVKAPDQLEDDFINLFVWVWSYKDYLKSCYETKGLQGKALEEEVNQCQAIMYVADIANRAKHGELRKSRSGEFAELIDVGFNSPQKCIKQIFITGSDVILELKNPKLLSIRATVKTKSGGRLEAITILNEAMEFWEVQSLKLGVRKIKLFDNGWVLKGNSRFRIINI